jgi:hypothetical protein
VRYLGVPEQLETEVYADGGDGGVDLAFNGASVDVKTVGRGIPNPALTIDVYQSLKADYYALASRVGHTDVRLIGYAPRQFVANAMKRSFDGTQYHFVEQDYLFPFTQRPSK